MASSSAHAERLCFAAALIAGSWLGCAHAPAPAAEQSPAPAAQQSPAPASGLEAVEYTFELDPGLTTLAARVCFRGAPPSELTCGMHSGAEFMTAVWVESASGRKPLQRQDSRVPLAGVPRDGCVGYSIDLAAASQSGRLAASRRGGALVTNVSFWLWRPIGWDKLPKVTARFAPPPGLRVLLPWAPEGDHYALDQSAFAFYGYAVFGQVEVESIAAPGATLQVAVLDGFTPEARSHIRPWLETAAKIAALPSGRFPRKRGLIAVIPTSGSDRPVRFGMATRGGGASLALLVAPDAGLQALIGDWVAVHEFCHLLHPFVERQDAWLSEGLATYYQEVLRVRAGVMSEAEAWQRLYVGSLRGRAARHSLSEESAAMFSNGSFPMVYWAGASFALMADVELRLRTRGAVTLDHVLSGLSHCCARSTRPTSARDVIREMDRIAGVPVFSELMQRWVLGPRMPDLTQLYARLGLSPGKDGVKIEAAAEQAWIREAIMRAVQVEPALRAQEP